MRCEAVDERSARCVRDAGHVLDASDAERRHEACPYHSGALTGVCAYRECPDYGTE